MIAPRKANSNSQEINAEATIQAVLALLNQREPISVSRWFCDLCGMIHLETTPLACESCGHEGLSQQIDTPREMNSRW
jgi:rubrerythrin